MCLAYFSKRKEDVPHGAISATGPRHCQTLAAVRRRLPQRHQEHPDPGSGGHGHRLRHRPDLRYFEHHPLRQKRSARQAVLCETDPGHRPGLCGGLPGHPHDAPGGVHLLRPALLHQQHDPMAQCLGGGHPGGVHQYRRLHGRKRPGRHHLHRSGPDRGRQGHRHDPRADHDLRHPAPGPAQHHAPDRQQPHPSRSSSPLTGAPWAPPTCTSPPPPSR